MIKAAIIFPNRAFDRDQPNPKRVKSNRIDAIRIQGLKPAISIMIFWVSSGVPVVLIW
jgi:hypothetical protein